LLESSSKNLPKFILEPYTVKIIHVKSLLNKINKIKYNPIKITQNICIFIYFVCDFIDFLCEFTTTTEHTFASYESSDFT
jgi:uncharacterized membrane protein YccF (DUF307 family)